MSIEGLLGTVYCGRHRYRVRDRITERWCRFILGLAGAR